MSTTMRSSGSRMRALLAFAVLGALLTLAFERTAVRAEDLAIEEFQQHYNASVVAMHGCHACRTGNCSHAVEDKRPGVYCGDLVMTFQPCCCTFRNECMTTIFSESCECFNSEEEEELMTTRFYLFVVLTLTAWVLLIYDKMCGGPYKIANSSHVLLANSPSAARSLAGSESEEDQDDSSSQQHSRESESDDDDDGDNSAQIELTVLSSPRTGDRAGDSAGDSASASTAAAAAPSLTSPASAASASGFQPTLPASTSAPSVSVQSV